jgi:anti-anti-sigma regulatory factor
VADDFRVEMLTDRGIAVLRVPGPRLEIAQRESFARGCDALLASGAAKVVVDLSHVDRIFSLFAGTIIDLHVRAERTGKSLSVLASPPVRESFERMGLGESLDIVADAGGAQPGTPEPPAGGRRGGPAGRRRA